MTQYVCWARPMVLGSSGAGATTGVVSLPCAARLNPAQANHASSHQGIRVSATETVAVRNTTTMSRSANFCRWDKTTDAKPPLCLTSLTFGVTILRQRALV
jgi:hypothetical protein